MPQQLHVSTQHATPYHVFLVDEQVPQPWRQATILLLLMVLAAAFTAGCVPDLLAVATVLLAGSRGTTATTCIFLHGAGAPRELAGPPTSTYTEYWGNVHTRTPKCSRRLFGREETLHTGWEDIALQRRVCSLLEVPPTERLVIFAHSSANIVLAAALNNRVCVLPASALWYAVAAPWKGSHAADRLPEICNTSNSWINPVIKALADSAKFCEGPGGGPSRGYSSLTPSNLRLPLLARWQLRVNGSMCGSSAFGLWSGDSFALQALAEFTNFGETNDGAVTLSSCRPLSASGLSSSHMALHYLTSINHYDLTCRHGDGMWGSDRRPCSWYEWVPV